jgi:hypothetical protein
MFYGKKDRITKAVKLEVYVSATNTQLWVIIRFEFFCDKHLFFGQHRCELVPLFFSFSERKE